MGVNDSLIRGIDATIAAVEMGLGGQLDALRGLRAMCLDPKYAGTMHILDRLDTFKGLVWETERIIADSKHKRELSPKETPNEEKDPI